jgi:hypothetical protein
MTVWLDVADTSTPNASADGSADITTAVDAAVVGTGVAQLFNELDHLRHALAEILQSVGLVVVEPATFVEMSVDPKFVLDGTQMLDELVVVSPVLRTGLERGASDHFGETD